MFLRTLGALELEGCDFQRPKPLLLLAYLALEGPQQRRHLAELFWPGAVDHMKSLTVALARIRRGAPGAIEADEKRAWALVETDAKDLLSALEGGDVARAMELYRGPFLEGLYLQGWSAELEEWVYQTRELLANRMRRTFLALADKEAALGRFGEAARQADAAYKLAGASPPEPEDLLRLYTLMLAGDSPYVAEVREEASTFDLDIARSPEDARERLARLPISPGDASPAGFGSCRFEQQIRFCTSADGVRIAYATVGQGPVLVRAANWLTHLDFDWNSPIWRHWLQALCRHHTLVRYDQRGCGLSDWEVEELSLEAFVQDLETVVGALGLERFPLLGMSQGAAVAIAYAVRHPQKVSHLILYGSYYSPEDAEEAQAIPNMMRREWGQDNPAFRQYFTTLFIPEATPEQMHWYNDLQRITTSPEMAVRILEAIFSLDARGLASSVSVPTLILHARNDAVVPFEEGRQLAALIPNAQFVPLESNNHVLLEDEPAWQRFLAEVYRFVGVGEPERPRQLSHLVGQAGKKSPI